jgi:hypothetical protein
MAITYIPTFQHQDWVDNVDRVQASGSNGFNIRFHQLETELSHIAAAITQIDVALTALGQAPPARTLTASFTPTFVATAAAGWGHTIGFAVKPAGATSAQGMMSIDLPHNATLTQFRVTGRNEGPAPGVPGNGDLRVTLRRMALAPDATSVTIARVDGIGSPFDNTVPADPQFAAVNNTQFRYFIAAQLNNAAANDTVLLSAFLITYTIQ